MQFILGVTSKIRNKKCKFAEDREPYISDFMEIKELQEIYASHPGVTALSQLTDEDYKKCINVNGLTASSAAVAIAGYMHREEKQTLFIVMNDAEEAGYFYHDLVQICGDKRVLFFPSSFKRALKYGQLDTHL